MRCQVCDMPRVSIIISTPNHASMVEEVIQSVLGQTYSDHEIVMVDNGSTHNTAEIVNTLLEERVTSVFQENHDRSSARNHATNLAQCQYLSFSDEDNIFLPTMLEKKVPCMERNPNILLSHTS